MPKKGLSLFAWFVLAYNNLVILLGAYVRATGSGAGCGSHWPLCNGEVIPRVAQIETIIEFSHRLSSGLAFILVVILVVWVFCSYPRRNQVRLSAGFSLLFIITEALVGAGLVLFGWVAQDISVGRVISISVHLVNTFLLIALLTSTAWLLSGGGPVVINFRSILFWLCMAGLLGVIIIRVTGAITALGDTLFPSNSLIEGIKQDINPVSQPFLRLGIWHPVIAILVGSFLLLLAILLGLFHSQKTIRFFSILMIVLFLFQIIAGVINISLMAPVLMQLVHLFLADAVWIILVLLIVTVFSSSDTGSTENQVTSEYAPHALRVE